MYDPTKDHRGNLPLHRLNQFVENLDDVHRFDSCSTRFRHGSLSVGFGENAVAGTSCICVRVPVELLFVKVVSARSKSMSSPRYGERSRTSSFIVQSFPFPCRHPFVTTFTTCLLYTSPSPRTGRNLVCRLL